MYYDHDRVRKPRHEMKGTERGPSAIRTYQRINIVIGIDAFLVVTCSSHLASLHCTPTPESLPLMWHLYVVSRLKPRGSSLKLS
jgi:hypothetical protein